MSAARLQGDAGTASMFLLWYNETCPPVVLVDMEEVKVYIQLMRTLGKGTPRFRPVPDDFLFTNEIPPDA